MMMAGRLSWNSVISRIRPITKAHILPRTQGEGEVGGFRCNSSSPSSTSTSTTLLKSKTDEPEPVYDCVTAYAPATISNLGLGFDFLLGCALDGLGDSVEVYIDPEVHPGLVQILDQSETESDRSEVNLDDDDTFCVKNKHKWKNHAPLNSAGAAAISVMKKLGIRSVGLSLYIDDQGIRETSRWLGLNSDASAAAAAFAVNELFGGILPISDLVKTASLDYLPPLTHYSAGAGSIAAAMIGGFVFIRDHPSIDIVPLRFSAEKEKEVIWVIVNPSFEAKASANFVRSVLPREEMSISRSHLRRKRGQAGSLVASIMQEDLKGIGSAMSSESDDAFVAGLIPGFLSVKKAAMEAGAFGCSGCTISGLVDKPMVAAITDDMNKAKEIEDRMVEAFLRNGGLKASAMVHRLDPFGAKVENRQVDSTSRRNGLG